VTDDGAAYLWVRVLGPVELSTDRGPVRLSRLGRALVAMLAADAGRVVSVDRLVEALWREHRPGDARNRVQAAVSAVRRALAGHGVAWPAVVTAHPGYRLGADPLRLDATEFTEALRRGRLLRAEGDTVAAVACLRSGVELWRGTAFDGVEMSGLDAECARLEELRLVATEELMAAELATGRAAELVAELTQLVTTHPFRETLRGSLMLALYRCGREADAVACYRAGRDLASRELGVEPGTDLQGLLRAILDRDPALAIGGWPPAGAPHRTAVPDPAAAPGAQSWLRAYLPADCATFTGRAAELDWLDRAARSSAARPLLVCGQGGVGKTTLAVHWAHRVRDQFPDGQLYLNLHGFDDTTAVATAEAIGILLHLLGAPARPGTNPDQAGTDPDQAAARLREALAGRRVLLVLDNAATADQVRPLLPGHSSCLTVVTSRDRLSGLIARDSGLRLNLDPFPDDDALRLLGLLVGDERIAAEPSAATGVVASCGRLPLAVRIAAANLLDAPDLTIAAYHDTLRTGPLDALAVPGDPGAAVRPVLDRSYRRLPARLRQVLRVLGCAPLTHLTAASVAAALSIPPPAAESGLRVLVQANLLETAGSGRYPGHDLIRVYAGERSRAEDRDDERAARARRLATHLAGLAAAADYALRPTHDGTRPDGDPAAAMDWFDHEYANLATMLAVSVERDWPELTIALAGTTRHYLRRLYRLAEWERVFNLGLAAARTIGDLPALAELSDGLADRYFQAREWEPARAAWEAAAAAYQAAGDDFRWALCHDNLGMLHSELGDPDMAVRHHHEALAVLARSARPQTVGTYIHLGIAYGMTERWDECRVALERALALATEVGSHEYTCYALHNLAELAQHTGEPAIARARAEAEINAADRGGLPLRAARGHQFLAALLASGDPVAAASHRRHALEIYRDLGHPEAAALALTT